MSWDLRTRYAFDSTEGQIPEGFASVYGQANSHANCVPASFTAALAFAGFPDIDPQLVTNQIYGPNFRGGFGDFTRMIAWIGTHVHNGPVFSDGPFNFAQAEAAGQNGQLIIVAGWIIPSSVTFAAKSMSGGFSHASLLVAHRADDSFLIWNTWFGTIQVYSRAVLAESLYEMSIMSKPTFSLGSGSLTPKSQEDELLFYKNSDNQQLFVVGESGKRYVWSFEGTDWAAKLGAPIARTTADLANIPDAPYFGGTGSVADPHHHAASEAQVAALPGGDNSAVLAAIADLKAHPSVAVDPTLSAKVDALAKHLGEGVA